MFLPQIWHALARLPIEPRPAIFGEITGNFNSNGEKTGKYLNANQPLQTGSQTIVPANLEMEKYSIFTPFFNSNGEVSGKKLKIFYRMNTAIRLQKNTRRVESSGCMRMHQNSVPQSRQIKPSSHGITSSELHSGQWISIAEPPQSLNLAKSPTKASVIAHPATKPPIRDPVATLLTS